MSSITDETAADRHAHWSDLRAHLRAEGAGNVPPHLLRDPDPDTSTRPDVPLIAYYTNVKQVSLGQHTPKDLITVLLTVLVAGLAFLHVDDVAGFGNQQWPWPTVVLVLIFFGIVVMLSWTVMLRPIVDAMTKAKGPLGLSCEELNLTLPDRGLHPHWRDVYSAACVRKPILWQTRFLCRSHVRVELNDGMSTRVHVDKNDCEPLAETMRALIVSHRTDTIAPSAGDTCSRSGFRLRHPVQCVETSRSRPLGRAGPARCGPENGQPD